MGGWGLRGLKRGERGGGPLRGGGEGQLEFSINHHPRSGHVAMRPHKTRVACGCYVQMEVSININPRVYYKF